MSGRGRNAGWSSRWCDTRLSGLWLVVLLLGSWGVAVAQGPVDAALRGRVVERGRSAAEAVVQVFPLGRQEGVQTVRAARNGTFLVQRLQPGVYRVTATAQDGASVEATIEVEAGELAEATLAVSGIRSQAENDEAVKAAAEVEPSATEVLARTLPLAERDVEALTQMESQVPAVEPLAVEADDAEDGPQRTQTEQPGFSFSGMAATQNERTVDGLSGDQGFRAGARGESGGGARAGVAAGFGQGAVRSLRVLPHTFSARYGGVAGGVTAVATRSSTAHLHGAGFVLERASVLAATNPFSVETHYRDGAVTSGLVKPSGSLAQFGGSAGMPVGAKLLPEWLRGRVSAFGSLEVQLKDDHIVSSPAVASFYALSAEQTALLGTRGVSAAATRSALEYLDSLTGDTARHAYRLQSFGRVDAALTQRDAVTLGYVGEHFEAPAGAALGQASDTVVARGMGSLGTSVVSIDALTARWLHRFSAGWNNEVRAQVSHDLEYETAHAPLPQEPAVGPGGYAPQVSIGPNGFAFGTPSTLGRVAYPEEWRVQAADDVQLRLGRHLVTLGADWSRLNDRIASITGAEGAFSYDSGVTKGYDGGLVDWITDYTFNVHAYPNGACPSINAATHFFCFRSFTQSFGPSQTEFVTHELAGFVEDSWRVRDGLTLTAGMRYDYTLLPLPQVPNYTLDTALRGLALPMMGATETFPEDRNNFGPRVSVAWSPGSRRALGMTAHLGYGWFYGRIPGATIRAALTDTALAETTTHVRIRPTTITQCPQVTGISQGFGYACAYTSAPPAAVAVTTSATMFAERYRTPAVQRAELTLERTAGRWAELRVSYALALATQLPDSVDVNIAPTTAAARYVVQGQPGAQGSEPFAVPLYTARRLAAYGPVTALVSNANATYHAATVEGHVRAASLELRGSFTFSRSIDYGAQTGATPALNGQFDPFQLGYDKGLSNQQVPERFTGSMIWAPHLAIARPGLREVLHGWRFAALAIAGSGSPYSYEIFGGTYLSGGRESINGAGGATYLPTVGRNTLRLAAHGRVDVRAQREFAVSARVKAETYVEAFNLLNTQTISSVQTRGFLLGTPAVAGGAIPLVFQNAAAIAAEGLTTTLPFGTPRSSTNGFNHERQLELGMRVRF
jgi:hypothetical protein